MSLLGWLLTLFVADKAGPLAIPPAERIAHVNKLGDRLTGRNAAQEGDTEAAVYPSIPVRWEAIERRHD